MTGKTEIVRHFLATLGYRLNMILQNAPDTFAEYSAGSGVRTPLEILRHMSDLMAATISRYGIERAATPEIPWKAEQGRFFGRLQQLDDILKSSNRITQEPIERLLQGPLADAMTHVGQLALLSRMAGAPLEAESYIKSDIQTGKFEL